MNINEVICLKIIILILFIYIKFINYKHINQYEKMNNLNLKSTLNVSYETSKFAIIRRSNCPICGFFSFYIVHLGCINKFINMGYIPIIDVMSFPNAFNGFNNKSKNNSWEIFFNQPFGFTLEEIKTKAKIIEYFEYTSYENSQNQKLYITTKY